MSDDFDVEPIPGLPENLPGGERIVWQGGPSWSHLARHAFHADKIAAYFGLLITLRLFFAVRDGQPLTLALASYGVLLLAATAAVGVVVGLAYLSARSTIYTITTKRVAMRFGIALPLTVNIPLSQIARADLAKRGGGTGDISLQPAPGTRIAYLVLWPHARAWRLNNPQPSLRSIPDAAQVALVLSEALQLSAIQDDLTVIRVQPVSEPDYRATASRPSRLQAAE